MLKRGVDMAGGMLTLALESSTRNSIVWYAIVVAVWIVGAVWAYRANR